MDETFTDMVSGKSRADRPALARLLRHVRRGDTIRVASMDRLARSLVDLAQLVQDLTNRGVRVEFVAERLTFDPETDDPSPPSSCTCSAPSRNSSAPSSESDNAKASRSRRASGVYRGRTRRLTPEQVTTAKLLVDDGIPQGQDRPRLRLLPPRPL